MGNSYQTDFRDDALFYIVIAVDSVSFTRLNIEFSLAEYIGQIACCRLSDRNMSYQAGSLVVFAIGSIYVNKGEAIK